MRTVIQDVAFLVTLMTWTACSAPAAWPSPAWFSGGDRVHVRVVTQVPSGTPPTFHREATTYYCVVVGPDGVGKPIPLWFY